MQRCDPIVSGSGPAGQRAAIQAGKWGKPVALVERREAIGGDCINTGTIPGKTMREAVAGTIVQHVIKSEVDVTRA